MPQNDDYLSRRHERREAARKRREAESKLLEEIADVKLCLHVSGFEAVRHKIQVNRTITAKAERWLKRLVERVM